MPDRLSQGGDCCCGPDWRKPKPNGTCATCGGWLPGERPTFGPYASLTDMWRDIKRGVVQVKEEVLRND